MKAITLLAAKTCDPSVTPASEKIRARLTPDSAVIQSRNPFFVPDDSRWTPKTLIGVKIDRLGMKFASKFARRYYSEVITAVHPTPASDDEFEWMRDGALIVSDTAPADGVEDSLRAVLDDCVSLASRYLTLKTGDLILIPSPLDDETTESHLQPGMNHEITGTPPGFPHFTLKVR